MSGRTSVLLGEHIVEQNEHGKLYELDTSFFMGTKRDTDGLDVSTMIHFPLQIARNLWLSWQDKPVLQIERELAKRSNPNGYSLDELALDVPKSESTKQEDEKEDDAMAKARNTGGKVVCENGYGRLCQAGDAKYIGTKFDGDGLEVTARFNYPRKMAEQKWLEWQREPVTDEERERKTPWNRSSRRLDEKSARHNANQARSSSSKLQAATQIDSDSKQKETEMSDNKKQSEGNQQSGKQSTCYAIMATGSKGTRPAMVLTDEQDARDMVSALQAAGAVMEEQPSYELVETILRH